MTDEQTDPWLLKSLYSCKCSLDGSGSSRVFHPIELGDARRLRHRHNPVEPVDGIVRQTRQRVHIRPHPERWEDGRDLRRPSIPRPAPKLRVVREGVAEGVAPAPLRRRRKFATLLK